MKGTKKSSAKNGNFAKSGIKAGSTLVLGVSGGPDSMYLFFNCLELQKKLKLKLIVAHVNHGLRGKAGNDDEKFVKNLCRKFHMPLKILKLKLKKSSEEAGRDARYKFFEGVRKKAKAQWILTAHHLNDNIETMLFNLIRGAHFNGIKGMAAASPQRHLLRPLLSITKKKILAHLKKEKIAYRLDDSNNNTVFSRNLLRKKIIPLFAKINPNFEQTFKDTLQNLTQTNQYLEQQCEKWLQKNTNTSGINLKKFLQEPETFQKLLLSYLYKNTHQSTKKLTNKHLEEVLKVIELRQAGKKKEFGENTFLELVRDHKKTTHYIRLTAQK